MPVVQLDDVTLHYREEGRGPHTLVLLHAFPVSSAIWEAQLRPGELRIIAPDFRGFGQSSTAPSALMPELARDVLALLDRLGIAQCMLAGVSMGGYVAMALARIAPARIHKLVLIDTQVGADDEAGRARRQTLADDVHKRGIEPLIEMGPKLLAPDATPAMKQTVERLIRANKPAGSIAAIRGLALRADSSDVLSAFDRPTLVVVGEKDGITPPDKARVMAAMLPKSTLVEIPGAGHLPMLERPDVFNDALKTFLTKP